jgi:hypothetical protein
MASTLAKYVDMENIPKKYGGKLDWQFGDSPNLEPAIANSLRWKEVIEEKGHKTLPLGPIKWQYDEDGDLVATAIGTENNQPRKRVIAKLHSESVAKLALSPGRAENNALFHTTSAQIPAINDKSKATPAMTESSQPSTNGAISQGSGGAAVSEAAAGTMWDRGNTSTARVGTSTAREGTSTAREGTSTAREGTSTPREGTSTPREGTSNTRIEQQIGTHAEGHTADRTPETRVDGQGEKQAIMEPNTVGQAPKEHPMKIPEPEEPQPSYIDQAKEVAGQAVETAKQLPTMVMGAVGMGGAKQDENTTLAGKKEDPEVDALDPATVEEFLRSQTMTRPESKISPQ